MEDKETSDDLETPKAEKVHSGVGFSLTSGGQPQVDEELVKKQASKEFERLIKDATLKITKSAFLAFCSFVLGAFVVAFWDLNSEIYKVSGQYSAKSEMSEFKEKIYQQKINELEGKLKEIECLNDIRVQNKAECRK